MTNDQKEDNLLAANQVTLQPVSVTRRMAASLPGLRKMAADRGLKIHHLGAGYPHPEVTDPRDFVSHKTRYSEHLKLEEGINDPNSLPEYLRESYAYTDTLGPELVRRHFSEIYGRDWDIPMIPDNLLPTMGATGGISLLCSLFERSGIPLAYLTDAPTYAGFITRAEMANQAEIYSVEMDNEGPIIERMQTQIDAARDAGCYIPFYYTVPDGHNPAGFSFSQRRREQILTVLRDNNILIVEDAPYIYISYADAEHRPKPFLTMDPTQTVHLFTGSKIGFPGPRIGFAYTEANLLVQNNETVSLKDLLLTEASADILFHNPDSLYGFDALLHDEQLRLRTSLWPVADAKLAIYLENRQIMLDGLKTGLGQYPELFSWTQPEAGFFTVFTFHQDHISTDEAFITSLVSEFGIVVIPMYDFYPKDARVRNNRAGLNQLRLSFCFSESQGDARRRDLAEAVATFCKAARQIAGVD